MSAISGLTLSVSGTSTLTGGANITGTTNTNNLNIINNSNFSQSGSGTFSTGTGAVTLNGNVICSTTSSFTGLATFNGNISLPSGKTLTLPSTRVISNSNDVVDTTSGQTVAGVKTFSNQIIANGGINAGSNAITCGSLTCSSETDTGALTVTGVLNANGSIVTNGANINAGIGSITCGSLTCSSENDTGALTVTGALNANSGVNLGLSSQNNTTSSSLTIAGTDDTTFNFFNYASGSNAYAKNVVISASNLVNTAGWNNNGDMGYAGSLYLNGGGYTETSNNGTQGQNLNGGHVYIQGGFGYATYGTNVGNNTLPAGGSLTSVPGNIYFNSGRMKSSSTYYNTYTNYMMINGSNGRVGINTTSPGYTLDVNGSINAGGGITCSSYSGPNGSNIYLIPATLPTASSNTGLGIAWNATGGITDTAFLTYGQGGTTQGFTFYSVNGGANSRSLLATIATYGTSFTNTITANGGLTIPAGQTLTVNGTLVVSGTYSPTSVSTSGVISANGGITMGSNQNITLASTFTTPTFGQLGYTASVSVAGPIVYNVSTNYNMCNLTVGVGVWIFNYGFTLSSSGTNTIQSYVSQLSNNSTFTGNYANTLNQFRGSIQTTDNTQRVSNTYSTVLTLTSSTTIYLTFQHVSQNSTSGINMFINATRIA